MLTRMAFRNIFRQKKRTVLTLITILFGIFFGIFADGFNSGMKWQIGNTYIKTQSSNMKIYKKEFYSDEELRDPMEYTFPDSEALNKILLADGNIKGYSKRLVFDGRITNGINELRAKYIGAFEKGEEEVFKRSEGIIAGRFIKDGESDKIVIGSELASSLKIGVGDNVTLTTRTKQKAMNAYDAQVVGIIKTGNPAMDSQTVFMPMEFARVFADTLEINDVAVKTEKMEIKSVKAEMEKLNKEIGGFDLETIGWFDETKDLMSFIDFRGRLFNIITFVILIMAAAGIVNTLLMAMLERKKEIGILMAKGMEKKEILRLFLTEGIIMGIIGSGIALAAGYIIVNYLQQKGIKINFTQEQMGNFPISDRLYFYFDIAKAFSFVIIGIIVSGAASLYPAIKAVKMEPVDAIRG